MKCLKICPLTKSVTQIEMDASSILPALYVHIGCREVEAVFPSPQITLYVDAEGASPSGFRHPRLGIIRGVAVAFGPIDENGADTSATVGAAALRDSIHWV